MFIAQPQATIVTMVYILVGIAGFLFAFAFDWASLRNIPIIKQIFGILAVGLIAYATVMVCRTSDKLERPTFLLPLGAFFLGIFLCLLIYSLFIEIPFRTTYARKGVGDQLVMEGTYALTRHPGVIWLFFVYVSLILMFPSGTLILAAVIWMLMDVAHVAVQDKFFFPGMFPQYHLYQQQTPFLVPNRQSISACLNTIRPRIKPTN
ncbi:MAG: hypothetical protein FJ008_06655 [Chloroflexi bacterium]|nr:hypothetical protein [Chloroflexota bacterium]MBM3172923.1 hypothetical protein [Chloroflexota bacterium]MBM3175253.1 hypothetical protein [Chloroflexota bacterium]